MKRILIVLSLFIFINCNTKSMKHELRRGDTFLLTKGFYQGCTFTVEFNNYVGFLECNDTIYFNWPVNKTILFDEWGAKFLKRKEL